MIVPATRGIGAIELLRELLPGVAIDALVLVTWLGSVVFLATATTFVYWFESRDGGALGIAAILGASALTLALKALFGLARPPEPLWLIDAASFGFPSGHAVAATVGWGALAAVLDRGARKTRFGVAVVVVALVALSRVALGVHYAVDVLAGIVVGGAYLGIVVGLDDVGRAFGAATVVGLLAAAVAGGVGDALLLLGAAVGGWFVWTRRAIADAPWGREEMLPAVGGATAVGALVLVAYRGELAAPLQAGIGAAAVGGVLLLPTLVERVRG